MILYYSTLWVKAQGEESLCGAMGASKLAKVEHRLRAVGASKLAKGEHRLRAVEGKAARWAAAQEQL